MASVLPTKSYASVNLSFPMPDLIEVQFESFERLKKDGLRDLFDEVSPIESYNHGMKLYFPGNSAEAKEWELGYRFGEPKNTIEECVERDLTYSSPMYVSVLLAGPEIAEPNKSEIFLGDFPEMTPQGTFIINGTERVVVSQLIRSPGVYFEADVDRTSGHRLATAKLIPDRGAWMEFETRRNDYLILKYNRRRTVSITIFLRALAAIEGKDPNAAIKTGTDEELIALFEDLDTDEERRFIESTFNQEPEWEYDKAPIAQLALLEFFRRMQPGDPVAMENAKTALGDLAGSVRWARGCYDALEGASALIVCTEWREFRSPDYKRMKSLMKEPAIFDGRNLFEPETVRGFGFNYTGVGRN